MSAVVLQIPAHPREVNTIRAALRERARHIGAHPAELARARRVAMQQLRAGASTGWAVAQGQRVLRGAEPASRPGGAA